jgi:general stress protein 26
MSDLKTRIYEMAKEYQVINLATITEDGKPRVRYVAGFANPDLVFRFCTFIGSNKVKQMRKNPNVHLTLGAKEVATTKNWLQVEGTAEVSTAKNERDAMWSDGLKAFFKGPDDPNYVVIIIRPSKIELAVMGSMKPEVWEGSY